MLDELNTKIIAAIPNEQKRNMFVTLSEETLERLVWKLTKIVMKELCDSRN